MRTSVTYVNKWIQELKKRRIREFQFKDLPDDLKNIGAIRKAKVVGKIREKKKIGSTIVWKIE